MHKHKALKKNRSIKPNKVAFGSVFTTALLFSNNALALDIETIKVNSKFGDPLKIVLTIDENTKDYELSEADADTYELFGISKRIGGKELVFYQDNTDKSKFYINGIEAFDEPVVDLIVNFKNKDSNVNLYKNINAEVEIAGIDTSFETVKIENDVKKNNDQNNQQKSKPRYNLNQSQSANFDSGTYKVKNGNTLYGIALQVSKKNNGDAVINAAWIYENNKSVFVNGNPNIIKSHYRINVPTKEDISNYDITKDEAREVIKSGSRNGNYKTRISFNLDVSKFIAESKNKSEVSLKEAEPNTDRQIKKETKEVELIVPVTPEESETLTQSNVEENVIDKEDAFSKRLEALENKIEQSSKMVKALKEQNNELSKKAEEKDFIALVSLIINAVLISIIGVFGIFASRKNK